MSRALVVALAWLTTVACSHARPKFQREAAPTGDAGVVYLYRVWRFMAAAEHPRVFLDGKPVGKLAGGTFFRFELPGGRHVVTIDTLSHLNWGSGEIEVAAGQEYFLRYPIEPELKWGAAFMEMSPAISPVLGAVLASRVAQDRASRLLTQPLVVERPPPSDALAQLNETTLAESPSTP